jgi:hypothetical protein
MEDSKVWIKTLKINTLYFYHLFDVNYPFCLIYYLMKAPELLSPAGLIKNMRYAFAYGADAVYAGLPRYSLRVRNNDVR